jgi:environmental stress-induced protein Ves
VITVLQGDGMSLCVDGDDTRPLLPLDPFAFSGESQVSCTLLGGAIRDFNLIYAPQRYSARLQWLDGEQRFFSSAGTVLVFSVSELLEVQVGDTASQLGRHDCLQLDGNSGLIEISTNAPCCVIELLQN